jgi:polyvinyl alcohol dehydrogenase (cytochrome)
LSAEQVPRLTSKWAFGFPDATSAWAQPSVVGGRLFVGSHNGTVYSLDARSGCIHWPYATQSSVRTGIMIGPRDGAIRAFLHSRRLDHLGIRHQSLIRDTQRRAAKRRIDVGAGPTIVGGMLYVNSGYGDHGGRPGNVMLAFEVPSRSPQN